MKDSTKLQWVDSEFSILGLTFSTRLIDIPNLNFNTALDKAKKVVNSWSYRQLTPLGKIAVIKSLILSKFVHLFISIPVTKTILQEIETLIYTYLWGGKPNKVSRKDICRTYLKGGLEMINLYNFEKSLKLGWLKSSTQTNLKVGLKYLKQLLRI